MKEHVYHHKYCEVCKKNTVHDAGYCIVCQEQEAIIKKLEKEAEIPKPSPQAEKDS
jgi:hypothetical protein